MTRTLIAYASKMGSTREIAEAIGVGLRERGHDVDVRDVRRVGPLDDYDAVVLGTAVYAARWRPEARRFWRARRADLTARRVHVFESGWVGTRPPDPRPTPGGRRRAAAIGASTPRVFGGRLDPALATGPLDRLLARRMAGDSRDWDEIRAWTAEIAATPAPPRV